MYAPVYWDENPAKFLELCNKYSTNILLAKLKDLRNNQGLPIEVIRDPVLAGEGKENSRQLKEA